MKIQDKWPQVYKRKSPGKTGTSYFLLSRKKNYFFLEAFLADFFLGAAFLAFLAAFFLVAMIF
ncbi:MAG: hypothetical protein IAF38_21745 [Bacteroidia bacterium]|nr:hypothetical protein [Bacteroidia bacterium]